MITLAGDTRGALLVAMDFSQYGIASFAQNILLETATAAGCMFFRWSLGSDLFKGTMLH